MIAMLRLVLLLAYATGLPSIGTAQPFLTREAPNWCENAQQYLPGRDGRPFDCASAGRCIRLNNYGCSQNHSATPYKGQLRTADGAGMHDPQFHVAYEHPKWSLQKTIGTLHRYQVQLRRETPLEIAETYAPWCDTLGSPRTRHGWGRTCADRLPSVGASYQPRCERTSSGLPLPGQCASCNCPNQLAAFYSKRIPGQSPTGTIQLFGAGGRPTETLLPFLQQVSRMELGYSVSERLLQDAVEAFQP